MVVFISPLSWFPSFLSSGDTEWAQTAPAAEGLLRDVLKVFGPVKDVTWASGNCVEPSKTGEPG
jgi:hypothetical protein